MSLLNSLSFEELEMLLGDVTAMREAGAVLLECGLTPTFDLTPGAAMRITTSAVMPAVEDGVTLTPLAADIVRRTSTRDLTHCDPDLSAQLTEEREDFSAAMGSRMCPEHVEIPSFLKHESTEAPPTSPASEPVDPPPALGEVVGGGAPAVEQPGPPAGADISAAPSRSDEAAPSVEAEAESGGGVEVAAPEAPAAPDAKPQPWSAAEDSTLIHTVVDLMVNRGMARKPAANEASKFLPGRTADACIYRAHTKAKEAINAAVSEAAMRQAQNEELTAEEFALIDAARERHKAAEPAPAPEPDPSPEQATPPAEGLNGEDLRVWQWVTAHRAKWPHTAGTDLDLAVGLGRGEKLNLIALDLGIDGSKLQERWDCLSRPIRNGQDKITLDGMPRLIKILRLIAKATAAAA